MSNDQTLAAAQEWWSTDIIDMSPGKIGFRGYAIQDLIGHVGFVSMIWLMLRGELPYEKQAALLEAALVAGVDHGPQAPSIAAARMAITCGIGLNNAMASGVNMLGDVHGGAGEQAVELYLAAAARMDADDSVETATQATLQTFFSTGGRFVPGFGHRFHPIDPRAPRLLALVDEAAARGVVSGRFSVIARQIEAELKATKGKSVPMNIDGATAVIFAELGFEAPLARGLFVLSRSVGILAHAWEQQQLGGRIKGPMPPSFLYRYTGEPPRGAPVQRP